jgi:tetratricopeptide (TPR) repeat protein/predicted aspartyl protease
MYHPSAMLRRRLLLILTVVALPVPPTAAIAACHIGKLAELPVTMTGLRPLVSAKINGADALFLADSGAFFSLLTPASAAQFKLSLEPTRAFVTGVGGEARAWLTTVKAFTLFDIPFRNVPFVVAGNELEGAAGVLGQNVFRILDADVEYDLAHGAIRLWRAHDCRHANLAYWAKDQALAVSLVEIEWATRESPHTKGVAFLNGARIRVLYDTGAVASTLTLAAAARAGIKLGQEDVVSAGSTRGVGQHLVQTWTAPFASFKIGDEEIRNTHLRIGDIGVHDTDMLIGADFFLSHRVYVANSQRRLYFTYNGGPVFNLTTVPPAQRITGTEQPGSSTGAAPAGAPTDTQAGSAATPESTDEPRDAPGLSRRGAAFAARRDYEHAIADLTRACELAPSEPKYFYQRGMAHWANKQGDLAVADFDQALKFKPDDVPALLARAQLRLQGSGQAAALADLDAADRAAPQQAHDRLLMGHLYARTGRFEQAIAEFDKWIAAHAGDVQMPEARNSRCRARALWGHELDKALADCNAAVKARPDTAAFLDSRGLARLRLGDLDKAIADYDASLKQAPRTAWPLYGRGLARLRKGLSADGEADVAAARAIAPHIEDEARRYGLTP